MKAEETFTYNSLLNLFAEYISFIAYIPRVCVFVFTFIAIHGLDSLR